jgi:regulator of protease activity HflC (stomatin/prohibitin superfamily)
VAALALVALSYTILNLIRPVDLLIGIGLVGLVWFVRAFMIHREIEVGSDEAKIVRRWKGHPEVIFRGVHRLNLGDRVTATYSLRTRHHAGNEEALTSREGDPLRVRSNFHHHIADPLRYHLRGKKYERRLAALTRESMEEEIGRFSWSDLWNCPVESNRAIRDNLSRKLKDAGMEVSDFRLEEIILPERAVKWRRNKLQSPSLQHYWQEFALA